MDVVLSLHGRIGFALVLYYGAVGVWAIVSGLRDAGLTSGLSGAIVVAEVAAIAQGLLGLVFLLLEHGPAQSLHVLYGVAIAVALPLASTLVQQRTPRGQGIAMGFAALFTAGLAIRGITTA